MHDGVAGYNHLKQHLHPFLYLRVVCLLPCLANMPSVTQWLYTLPYFQLFWGPFLYLGYLNSSSNELDFFPLEHCNNSLQRLEETASCMNLTHIWIVSLCPLAKNSNVNKSKKLNESWYALLGTNKDKLYTRRVKFLPAYWQPWFHLKFHTTAVLAGLYLHLGLSKNSCINSLVCWLEIGVPQNHLTLNDLLLQGDSGNFA